MIVRKRCFCHAQPIWLPGRYSAFVANQGAGQAQILPGLPLGGRIAQQVGWRISHHHRNIRQHIQRIGSTRRQDDAMRLPAQLAQRRRTAQHTERGMTPQGRPQLGARLRRFMPQPGGALGALGSLYPLAGRRGAFGGMTAIHLLRQ